MMGECQSPFLLTGVVRAWHLPPRLPSGASGPRVAAMEIKRGAAPPPPRARGIRLVRMRRLVQFAFLLAVAGGAGRTAAEAPPRPLAAAVYEGAGATGKGVPRVLALLEATPGVTATRIRPEEIRAGTLRRFDVVVFTGGSGHGQAQALEPAGREEVKTFVRQGGRYVGICAGSYLASCGFSWGVNLIKAKTLSPLWKRGKGTVQIELTDRGREILGPFPGKLDCLYAQGPIVGPAHARDLPVYEPLAFFRSEIAKNNTPQGIMIHSPAIFASHFEKGRVLCFSPHPEQTAGLDRLVTQAIIWAGTPARQNGTGP